MNFKKLLKGKKLDAIFVSKKENIFWLTGFWCGEDPSFALLLKDKIYLFVSILALETAKTVSESDTAPCHSQKIIVKNLTKGIFKRVLKKENIKKIGFEKNNLSFARYKNLQKLVVGANLCSLQDTFEKMRMHKTEDEIYHLQKSAQITDKALAKTLKHLKVGVTEKEIAWQIEKYGREQGAEEKSFDFIVAFSENGAIPHHRSTERKLQKNDPILIDCGFKYNHYCSDLSRSFFFGRPTNEWIEVYNLVLEAQEAAIVKSKTAKCLHEADDIVRKIFNKKKLKMPHTTGHGVGLEIHESLRLASKYKQKFAEGMVFTIEPGVYLSGKFGVRIEDLCVIQNGKIKLLSKFEKNIKKVII